MSSSGGRGTAPMQPASVVRQQGIGPLQVIPPGFMGLLQLKQMGHLPGTLDNVVQGVIELRDWFLTARRLTEVGLFGGIPVNNGVASGTVGGINFAPSAPQAQVPPNQIWYVEEMTISVLPAGAEAATDALRYCCALVGTPVAQSGFQQLGPDVSDYTLAARTRKVIAHADRGFWAFPGDIFQAQIFDNVTTNGWNFSLSLRATPCPL